MAQYGDKATHNFLIEMEQQAKSIIKKDIKKKRESSRADKKTSATQLHSHTVPLRDVQMSSSSTQLLPPVSGANTLPPARPKSSSGRVLVPSKVMVPPNESKVLKSLTASPYGGSVLPSIGGAHGGTNSSSHDTSHMQLTESPSELKHLATTILSGKPRAGQYLMSCGNGSTAAKTMKRTGNEKQGPIDYSVQALKFKYRGEDERKRAYEVWEQAQSMSNTAMIDDDFVLPVAKVTRHPLQLLYEKLVHQENYLAHGRIKSRLLMKRFLFDVHEVWFTNLQHIREHQPARLLAPSSFVNTVRQSHAASTDLTDSELESDMPRSEEDIQKEKEEQIAMRGIGLGDRRDVDSILSMKSQIPSVSFKRAMQKAYFTTRLPDPRVVLDYVPGDTAVLPELPVMSPVIEHIGKAYFRLPHVKPLDGKKEKELDQKPAVVGFGIVPVADNVVIVSIDRLLLPISWSSLNLSEHLSKAYTSGIGYQPGEEVSYANDKEVSAWWRVVIYDCGKVTNTKTLIAPESDIQNQLTMMHHHKQHQLIHHYAQSEGDKPYDGQPQPLGLSGSADMSEERNITVYSLNAPTPLTTQQLLEGCELLELTVPWGSTRMPVAKVWVTVRRPSAHGHSASTYCSTDKDVKVYSSHSSTQFITEILITFNIMLLDGMEGDASPESSVLTRTITVSECRLLMGQLRPNHTSPHSYLQSTAVSVDVNASEAAGAGNVKLSDRRPSSLHAAADLPDLFDNDECWFEVNGEMEKVWKELVELLVVDSSTPTVPANDITSTASDVPVVTSGPVLCFKQLDYCVIDEMIVGQLHKARWHEYTQAITPCPKKALSSEDEEDEIKDQDTASMSSSHVKNTTPPSPPQSILPSLTATAYAETLLSLIQIEHKDMHVLTEAPKSPLKETRARTAGNRCSLSAVLSNHKYPDISNVCLESLWGAFRALEGDVSATTEASGGAPATAGTDAPPPTNISRPNTAENTNVKSNLYCVPNERSYYTDWETCITYDYFPNQPSSTLIATNRLSEVDIVPGSCDYGKFGLWFNYTPNTSARPRKVGNGSGIVSGGVINRKKNSNKEEKHIHLEYTRASAYFFRNPQLSTTDTVLVNMSLSLDTPILFPPVVAWEDFNSYPVRGAAEPVACVIPSRVSKSKALLESPLVSPLEGRVSALVAVFSSIPLEGIDYPPLNLPTKPYGFCRHWPSRNSLGFRQRVEVTLLGVDPVLPTVVFGITKLAAQANVTAVNTRNIWHSTLAITEHIARPRVPKDYHYILAKEEASGSNDPASFTVRNRGGEFLCLNSSAFTVYELEYTEIKERRDMFARQLALNNKIEKSEMILRAQDKAISSQMRLEQQRIIEKKLRKATKSEKGWRRRYLTSTVVEIQGCWERRKDDRTGVIFFHKIEEEIPADEATLVSGESHEAREIKIKARLRSKRNEKFVDTCQWEVPTSWDGDCLIPVGAVTGGAGLNTLKQMGGSVMRGNVGGGSVTGSSVGGEDGSRGGMVHADPNLPFVPKGGGPIDMNPFQEPGEVWIPGEDGSLAGSTGSFGHPTGDEETPGILPTALKRATKENMKAVIPTASLLPEWSVAASQSVVPTIDTANLEHIAEQLVTSDELVRVLARRLGLPENQLVPAQDLHSIFSVGTPLTATNAYEAHVANNAGGFGGQPGSVSFPHMIHPDGTTKQELTSPTESGRMAAPRGGFLPEELNPQDYPATAGLDKDLLGKGDVTTVEFDSDDDCWSDDEQEAGDMDEDNMVEGPTNPGEVSNLRRQHNKETQQYGMNEKNKNMYNTTVPGGVPMLNLGAEGLSSKDAAGGDKAMGWRRLPRPEIAEKFYAKCFKTHTLGPDADSSNSFNSPIFLLPISPVDACQYAPTAFEATVESIYVKDIKKDMERALATLQRNINREEQLTKNIPTDDLLLFGEAKEMTSNEVFLAKQHKEDQNAFEDPREAAIEMAIMAAKSSNIAQMEDSLEEDIPIDCSDKFGNSLFILACQQGSKRMCKFLLRRGAAIDMQNLSGNTGLHYCFAYGQPALGDYLIQKGANDSIVNVDGYTCYEGLGAESLNDRDVFAIDEEELEY